MRLLLTLLFCILFNFSGVTQNKEIKGDTSFSYRWSLSLKEKFNLSDFTITAAAFGMRFWINNQVIEILKDGDSVSGQIINYIYWNKSRHNEKQELLFNKTPISKADAINISNILSNSTILELPSDNEISNWSTGFDGTTYIIEHSEKNIHWFKKYWSPFIQDSVPEALIVEKFVQQISEELDLKSKYVLFEKTLPRKGCYNIGGSTYSCYPTDMLSIGYIGSVQIPVGLTVAKSFIYIGKIKTDFGVFIDYLHNQQSGSDLSTSIRKWGLLNYKNPKTSDCFNYRYRNRKFEFSDYKGIMENHKIQYGVNWKGKISASIGSDYLIREKNQLGGLIYLSKFFNKHDFSTYCTASIFDSHIDYTFGVSRFLFLNRKYLISGIGLGLDFEEFYGNKNLFFRLNIGY